MTHDRLFLRPRRKRTPPPGDERNSGELLAIITEAEIHTVKPPATLRVADRFTVNAEGKIIEQENHFDPRDVTNPGWQNG